MASDTWKFLPPRLRNHLPRMLGVAVLSTAVAAGCWLLGGLGLPALERALYDRALTTFTRGRGQSSDIVVVAIDQSSLDGVRNNPTYARDFGAWPWSRGLWARVMEELAHQGARAVLFDGVMDEPSASESADADFARVLRDTRMPVYLGMATHPRAAPLPKVEPVHPPPAQDFEEAADPMAAMAQVLAFPVRTDGRALPRLESESLLGVREPNNLMPPGAPLLGEADGFGLVELEPDPDGLLRRTRFAYTDGANAYVTLPVAAAADFFEARELVFSGRTMRLGSREFEVNPDGSAELDFGGPLHERFRIIPVIALLDAWTARQDGNPTGLHPDVLRDRLVVIGATAWAAGEPRATPFGAAVPGVSKQLAVLENLLAGRFITEAPFWVSLLFALGLAVLSAVLLMSVRSPALELAWLLLAVVPIAFGVMGASLALGRVHVLAALPVAAGLLSCLGAMASNHLFANREAAFIRQAFSRYMEPRLIEQMLQENQLPRLDGEERELTAFFSDIRGFSSFSESFQHNPRELVRVLNQYLTRVSSALLHEGGCLDKYIGDAVVCLFGAPINHTDHAVRACRGALKAQAEVAKLRAEFRAKGLPDVYTRIGLNSARLFVGNFGSEQLFDYTAMGDGMNLASRLEGANKAYGSLIMIGPRTYELARDHIEVRELDRVRVAGKAEAVTVYELLALKGELPAKKRWTVQRYHEALALYREERFAEAAGVLAAQLSEDPEDGPTAVLLSRCRKYEQHPPSHFDGVANLEK